MDILNVVQAVSVVTGVVISVLSFNWTRLKEAQKPFLELRQKLYMEAVQQAGILANPSDHTADEMKAARRRFRELYVAELSMVESPWVETKMVELAKQIDPGCAKSRIRPVPCIAGFIYGLLGGRRLVALFVVASTFARDVPPPHRPDDTGPSQGFTIKYI
jgi:hypothetical protein